MTLDVSRDMIRKQLTVIGSWTFSSVIQGECARFVADRGIDVERLFTQRWTLDQAAEAYRCSTPRPPARACFCSEGPLSRGGNRTWTRSRPGGWDGRQVEVTRLGFGGGTLGDPTEVIDEARADLTVETAYAAGIGHFDTSPWYGNGKSEHRLGRVLRTKPRAELRALDQDRPGLLPAEGPADLQPGALGGRPAVRPALRLQPRRRAALLRGQPDAARPDHGRRAADPRPRPQAPEDRGRASPPPSTSSMRAAAMRRWPSSRPRARSARSAPASTTSA